MCVCGSHCVDHMEAEKGVLIEINNIYLYIFIKKGVLGVLGGKHNTHKHRLEIALVAHIYSLYVHLRLGVPVESIFSRPGFVQPSCIYMHVHAHLYFARLRRAVTLNINIHHGERKYIKHARQSASPRAFCDYHRHYSYTICYLYVQSMWGAS